MTQRDESQSDFPREEAPDIPPHVSSLTRRDLDGFLGSCGVSPLTDWQWRVLVGLGLLAGQERTAIRFREAARATPYAIVTPATGQVEVTQCVRGGGVCPPGAECDCRRGLADRFRGRMP